MACRRPLLCGHRAAAPSAAAHTPSRTQHTRTHTRVHARTHTHTHTHAHTPCPPHSNNLSSAPDELAELRHLRALRLKYNQLRRLPPVASRLPELAVLELAGHQISRLDASAVAGLAALRELDLSGNQLAELPAGIARLPRLEVLHLENNRRGLGEGGKGV
jgi:Leucine-rich repeat (LRR) protein